MLTSELVMLRSAMRRAYAAGFERAARRVRQLVPEDSKLAPLKRELARWLRPVPRRRLDAVLDAFVHQYPRAVFVQIGSNDGEQQDPLTEAIRNGRWTGVMVEPVPYVFERLKHNYAGLKRVRFENVAVAAQNGTAAFFHIPKVSAEEEKNLPQWYDALGSFSREIIASHQPYIPDIESRIAQVDVPTLTFESLCERNGLKHLDLVHIDTEGYDFEILKLIDFERWRPKLVIYEHHHLGADRAVAEAYLRERGYELMREALDTWALRVDGDKRADRAVLKVWRKLQKQMTGAGGAGDAAGASAASPAFAPFFQFDAEERRLLTAAFDETTPLPPGASVYLSSNNPRLAEIRKRYQALDLPVSARSQWHTARVEQHIDLCYFRGDNPYVWHYRELPRATRLKFFIYLEYLRGHDQPGLLSRLTEDGGFGCWTHQFPQRPRVSRDLLDSVNELLFLDRAMGLLKSKKLRVLDIGAGYGRMAHRMTAAVTDMADYCCVDAIAESSFLCEFYLRSRGIAPPGRVVLLDQVMQDLKPGTFDLAVNIHSFSECPEAAVRWWLDRLVQLKVPRLFIVPNEADGLLSTEPDGSKRDLLPLVEAAGYRLKLKEKAIADNAVRELLMTEDNYMYFEREGA